MLNHFFKAIIGLTLVVLSLMLLTYSSWYTATAAVIKGGIVLIILLIGLGLGFLGLTELKEAA